MEIAITPVKLEEKEILRNLLEKYNYEFSQYDNEEVNSLGLYGYDWLDCYWTEENRFAFFIRVQNQLAGFFMVNDYPESKIRTDYCMAEFFVLYKYRRGGVGSYAANWAFDHFPGTWQLKRHPKNRASVLFWDRVVREYTKGNYQISEGIPGHGYGDGTPAEFLFFSTGMEKNHGLSIRRALPEDAKWIYELNRVCLGYDFPLEQTEKRLAECLNHTDHFLAVALEEEKIVGYVHACDYDCVLHLLSRIFGQLQWILAAVEKESEKSFCRQWKHGRPSVDVRVFAWFPAMIVSERTHFMNIADITTVKTKRILKKLSNRLS